MSKKIIIEEEKLMVTYKEILQLEYDKKQTQFAISGELIINKKIMDEKTPLIALINEKNFWICPFCLETSNKFIIENKGLIKCSNCLVNMKIKTLLFIKDCSNEDYTKWVFEYRLSGFFFKLKSGNNSFEKWVNKMKELGISYEFWNEYNKLKCDYEKEEKEDKIDYAVLQKFIDIIINKLNNGLTKEQIINELDDVDVSMKTIDYCFNEALLIIKRGNL